MVMDLVGRSVATPWPGKGLLHVRAHGRGAVQREPTGPGLLSAARARAGPDRVTAVRDAERDRGSDGEGSGSGAGDGDADTRGAGENPLAAAAARRQRQRRLLAGWR